jgi:Sulfotransferase domain
MTMMQKLVAGTRWLLGTARGGRNVPVFPDDTFIVSYPRSGNTWTRFLIANLINSDEPATFANIERRVPEIEANTRRQLERFPRPRILKSHEYFDPRYKKVIYIVRDPRDVVLSYYYFQLKKRFIEDGCPMDWYVSRFIAGEVDDYASWGDNVATWLVTRYGSSGFLLLRYEDMFQAPQRELAKVASFLGIEADPPRLDKAVELSSADRMRELEKKDENVYVVTRRTRKDIPFIRTAVCGGWKSTLPLHLAAQIELAWGPIMKTLGYELSRLPASQSAIRDRVWTALTQGHKQN